MKRKELFHILKMLVIAIFMGWLAMELTGCECKPTPKADEELTEEELKTVGSDPTPIPNHLKKQEELNNFGLRNPGPEPPANEPEIEIDK
jgi:hypothetical protein